MCIYIYIYVCMCACMYMYSAFRFKCSALKVGIPACCAIHVAENPLLGRKFQSETRSNKRTDSPSASFGGSNL